MVKRFRIAAPPTVTLKPSLTNPVLTRSPLLNNAGMTQLKPVQVQPSPPTVRDVPIVLQRPPAHPTFALPKGIATLPYQYPHRYPIHLTASTTLAANSTGGVNAIALKNPLGQAMEILEIKFQLYQDELQIVNLLGTIACKLDLGKYPLTGGYVPLWCMGRAENLYSEMVSDPSSKCVNEFTWRLPKPLYVPADAVVLPTFQHRGLIKQDIQIRISYSARSIPAGAALPSRVALPYAAAWSAKSFYIYDAGTDASRETDLVNPFDEPLHLQRFTGRVGMASLAQDTGEVNQITDGAGEGYGGYGRDYTPTALYSIRMVDSYGRPLVRTLLPFRTVFSGVTRSWEVAEATIDPRAYVLAHLKKTEPAGTLSELLPVLITQAYVGMVGYRYIVGSAQ